MEPGSTGIRSLLASFVALLKCGIEKDLLLFCTEFLLTHQVVNRLWQK